MQQLKITQSVTDRTMTVESYLRDISKLPMVSPEEEIELAVRIQQGDEKAFNKLVEANLRFVISVAKAYQSSGLSLSDLIEEGNIGLIKAARRFDHTRGFKFISYAVWWIRQQIMQAISDQGRIVRLPLNHLALINKINREKNKFAQQNEREPSDEELAEFLDICPEKITEAVGNSAKFMSFDTPFGEDGDGTLLDVVPDKSVDVTDKSLEDESLHKDLIIVMQVLSEREREIIAMTYGIGYPEMTLEEIGERMSLTRERVRQIREKGMKKLSAKYIQQRLVQYR